jgi:hypothetical protein
MAANAKELTFAGARIHGNTGLSEDDLLRGIGLRKGIKASTELVRQDCHLLSSMKVFDTLACVPRVEGSDLWMDVTAENAMQLVFDNFVWTTHEKIVQRLKTRIPLLTTPYVSWREGLNEAIVKGLNELLREDGVKGTAIHETFWAQRGKAVYIVKGLQIPVVDCRIEGSNPPTGEPLNEWRTYCIGSDQERYHQYSAAGRAFAMYFALNKLYRSRGYMNPVVSDPQTELLPSTDGSYPVRVIFKIDSGPLYRFDSVHFNGELSKHEGALRAQWKLAPGDTFDEAYISDFTNSAIMSQPWAIYSATSTYQVKICKITDPIRNAIAVNLALQAPKRREKITFRQSEHCHWQFSLTLGKE